MTVADGKEKGYCVWNKAWARNWDMKCEGTSPEGFRVSFAHVERVRDSADEVVVVL